MTTRIAVLFCALALVSGCGYGDEESPAADPRITETFSPAKVLLDGGEESVIIDVEVAESEGEHRLGLMFRESLPEDAGMLFVFEGDTQSGFWMKDTLIPLSVAFIDSESTVVKILDMEPCREDPCPVYEPGVTYAAALEVNQGAFAEWGIEEGDRVTVTR
ncbi:MAG: DUF192 domain-containing protein [Actinomycetota bacterium]